MAIILPLLKTMPRLQVRKLKRIDTDALLDTLESMRLDASNRHDRAEEMEIAEQVDYYAGRNDALIDAMQEIREMN